MRAEAVSNQPSEVVYRRYLAALILFHQAAAERAGLSGTDYQAANLLDVDGPMTSGQLATRLRLTTGATTRLVDRLVADGVAERVRDTQDRRKAMIQHTGVLPGDLASVLEGVRGPIEAGLDALTPEQRAGVTAYLTVATAAYARVARDLGDKAGS